jgi:hypothetical protein
VRACVSFIYNHDAGSECNASVEPLAKKPNAVLPNWTVAPCPNTRLEHCVQATSGVTYRLTKKLKEILVEEVAQ